MANMILYAMDKYKTPVEKVFVTGGSSGAMMANVLAATYPQLISAVSAYSGVAAGCFVSSSGGVAAWNNTCSGGSSRATAPNNYGEQVKQWTNVLGENVERKDFPAKGFSTSDYTDKEGTVWVEGIWAQGVGHSVPPNLSASKTWFGL
ncbi:putative acetyl xylan protein [Copromyces sp. CBS 386.78]|nr:putative acetyl xylan protein [Copromyces sp. CBS 386.78]